jgi:outer membrane efflux protein
MLPKGILSSKNSTAACPSLETVPMHFSQPTYFQAAVRRGDYFAASCHPRGFGVGRSFGQRCGDRASNRGQRAPDLRSSRKEPWSDSAYSSQRRGAGSSGHRGRVAVPRSSKGVRIILGAEQVLIAASARIGIAKADFFPRIGLTSLFRRVSPELSTLTSGSSAIWAHAAGAAGPIFTGGQLKGQYRAAIAAFNQAKFQYLQDTLRAFQEVSDALVSEQKLAELEDQQKREVSALNDAVAIANKRYRGGLASYYEVLEAQQLLFPAEIALSQTPARPTPCGGPTLQGLGRRLEADGLPMDSRPALRMVFRLNATASISL